MAAFEIFNHDEKTTPTYQVTLLDEAGAPIPDADLLTLRLTFYDQDTAGIINTRTDQDALNANDVAVSNGVVTWSMQVDDTPIVTAGKEHEIHVAEWEWTYQAGATPPTLTARHKARFRTRNFLKEA